MATWIIKKSVNIFQNGSSLRIVFMNSYDEEILHCTESSLYLIRLLANGQDEETLCKKIIKKFPDVRTKDIQNLLSKLASLKVIENYRKSIYTNTFLDRQVNFYSDLVNDSIQMQKSLAKKSVLILGLGGVGSWIAYPRLQ